MSSSLSGQHHPPSAGDRAALPREPATADAARRARKLRVAVMMMLFASTVLAAAAAVMPPLRTGLGHLFAASRSVAMQALGSRGGPDADAALSDMREAAAMPLPAWTRLDPFVADANGMRARWRHAALAPEAAGAALPPCDDRGDAPAGVPWSPALILSAPPCASPPMMPGLVRTGTATPRVESAAATVVPFAPAPAATVPTVIAGHPRLLLDAATLARMQADVAANTPEWVALKANCDRYVGGQVNYPTGTPYPNPPDLGPGYQGEEYLPAVLAEAMCYQALKSSNPTAAATYGAKGVDILLKMSTPFSTGSGNQGQDPCTDSGYGIRNFGVGFGLGYDWLYDLLTPAQRAQVYTTANAWLVPWETSSGCAYFAYTNPQSNYYAGYFHAKAVIALATFGDNPSAQTEWNDWYANQFVQKVQPYYSQYLAGGGWPEGFGNYGPPAILNLSLPMREVRSATGANLVQTQPAFTFPLESADYAMHFAWPSRAYFDDRDMNHSNGTATPPVGTPWVGFYQQLLGALAYWGSSKVGVFHQYTNEVGAATSNYHPSPAWLAFLDDETPLPTAPTSSLPLSYLAAGMGMVAARSDWSTTASWMSFRAAPYINNPNQGEEGFDEGSIAVVRSNTPLLVNTWGWMVHEPNGSSDENLLYNDLYGGFNGSIYQGNKQIYNIFYVRNMSGGSLAEAYGQGMFTPATASTKVALFEDRQDYVYLQATGLADMYRPFKAGPAVTGWTRQVVYLRPNLFIVYDRTSDASTAYDQFLAWHFPAQPVAGSAASGQNRLDITYNGTYAGAMTTVYPANAALTTIGLYPSSNPTKVWQVQERPGSAATSQTWLTVFDTSSTAAAVAAATPVTVTQGNMVGVRLTSGAGVNVVLQSAAAAGTAAAGPISYVVPALSTHHVITELAPGTGYAITTAASGSNLTVNVGQGGTFMTSTAGVLDFYIDAAGTVQQQPPVKLTAPVSDLPVAGYPKPYRP